MKHLPDELQDTIKQFLVFKPKNKKEQQEAIDLWVNNKEKALDKYGDISSWDTSLITEFHNTAKKVIFKPKTKKELQEAVNLWCKKKDNINRANSRTNEYKYNSIDIKHYEKKNKIIDRIAEIYKSNNKCKFLKLNNYQNKLGKNEINRIIKLIKK